MELTDIRTFDFCHCDAVIFPGGSPVEQNNAIGKEGIEKLRNFVENGGHYLGICAGAFLGAIDLRNPSFGLCLLPIAFVASVLKQNADLVGTIRVKPGQFLDETTSFPDGNAESVEMRYRNGALFECESKKQQKKVQIIGCVVECSQIKKVQFRSKMMRKAAIVQGRFGKGNVILCGPHPEATPGLENFTWKLIEKLFDK